MLCTSESSHFEAVGILLSSVCFNVYFDHKVEDFPLFQTCRYMELNM